MGRQVFPIWFVILAVFVGIAITACRDIDEPPPELNIPADGGMDVEGGLAGFSSSNCAQSIAA